MADNQKQSQSSQKKAKKKRRSYIKDGVVLKVSDIEKECDRLRRRPRAALYPLLPITEPLKLKRKSIHLQKGRRRHRKHCRKRLHGGIEKRKPPTSRGIDSRTRLVPTTTTSGSEVSSLACSRNRDLLALHNQKSSLNKPHWASAELFVGDCSLELPRPAYAVVEHPKHHHYHIKKHKHRICHHNPLLCGHRTSMTTSLKDLRQHSKVLSRHHHRRCLDPEAGPGDKDSTSSNSRSRKIVSFIVASVASFILLMCVALVAVTLRLTPAIDELVRKGNEEIYRSMSAGASTSSPTTEDAVVTNNSTPPSGTPG